MTEQQNYQVLARKYRPEVFSDLIGQEAMVRTLKNAFEADRIAHAFIMTGIRGTGKTTTARIIAKGMNCIGIDGNGKPTTEPCGQCEHCQQIVSGRHVDVLEMDAASNTSVNDIREIIDGVHYAAASARYKIYIIDEVHMLSNSAFNALLKTLEEPPSHVKFIFATTEIRKVPVTVLSRCQRFDLRRIEPEDMHGLMTKIASAEDAQISDDAVSLIVRAAEGSARDAISLLDQAIAHGQGETTAEQVRAMIGLADRGRILDLFEMVMRGQASEALAELAAQYADGADPLVVLRDLADVTHWISVLKISPASVDDPTIAPDERDRGTALAEALQIRILTRMWQMLLKALDEVSHAPNPMMAAEMAIIRLTHAADLPSPDEVIRKLQDATSPSPNGGGAPTPNGNGATTQTTQAVSGATPNSAPQGGPSMSLVGNGSPVASQAHDPLARYEKFETVVGLIRARRDPQLLYEVETKMRVASYQPGFIEFTPTDDAPDDLASKLAQRLTAWTGQRWLVTVINDATTPTIAEDKASATEDLHAEVMQHPSVLAVKNLFPDVEIHKVHVADGADQDMLAPVEDDENWDPFEED